MENLALTTLLLPFIGALVVSFSPQRRAAEWGVLFAALTTLCMLSLIWSTWGMWHCLAWSLIA
ncbi:TPA: hypothetical protein KZS56_000564 [Escherichia coli]|nr:hypothetical protein [Escherichia coli]